MGGGRTPDELPKFKRSVLEALREPLESDYITISRAALQIVVPAKFQLIAAMNPCPCGYSGSAHKACACTEHQVQRYLSRLSNPLLDRLDMPIEVPDLSQGFFSKYKPLENSQTVKVRIERAHTRQKQPQLSPR